MQDVALRAGVSSKTVSRVFNGDEHVSEETRAKVTAAMEELNYVPNMMARTFRAGRAPVVGIAVPDIGDPFFATIIRTIDREAKAHGMAIAVTSLSDDPENERGTVEALLRLQINGLIIAPAAPDQHYLQRWMPHLPVVCIDRAPTNLDADTFVEDDVDGAIRATTHLYERGHRRIAFIGDAANIPTKQRRLTGYRQALAQLGLTVDEGLIALGPSDEAAALVSRLLRLPDPPTAIFSSNARTSLGVFPALQNLRRTDVGLVSFGDFPMAAALQPSVTVIDQNPAELGRLAATRLFDRLENGSSATLTAHVLPVTLVERASSPEVPVRG